MSRLNRAPLALVGLALAELATGCDRATALRSTAQYRVALSMPRPVHVGEQSLSLAVTPRDNRAVPGMEVWLHYYPFVHRVKDSLAAPEEVVRVVAAVPTGDGYRATVRFDRAGPWKIAVRLVSPGRATEIVYFTVNVQATAPGDKGREAVRRGDRHL
jgi:hypothetical protein